MIHVNVYHKYSDTLNTFPHAISLKQSKSYIQRSSLESVCLSNDKMGHFHYFKSIYFFCWAFSFVLFTVHEVKNVQVTSKGNF